MSAEAMTAALDAADRYLASQRVLTTDEQLERLSFAFEIVDVAAALTGGPDLRTSIAESQLRLIVELPSSQAELAATETGWRNVDRPTRLTEELQALAHREEREEWLVDELRPAAAEIAGGRGRLTLPKHAWRGDIERELDRTVWIGPTLAGFERWLGSRDWRAVASALYHDHPGAGVLVRDWRAPARRHGRLAIGRPSDHLGRASDDGLDDQLARVGRRDATEVARWRASLIDPGVPAAQTCKLLRGVASAAAAWAIAEARDDLPRVRPLRSRVRAYKLPTTALALEDGHGDAIRALVAWAIDDLTATRLHVAHRVAAGEIVNFTDDTPAHAVRQAADLAYAAAIDTEVHSALDRQAEFERTFVELDNRVAEVRAGVAATVDQAVARALAGALAVAIAALASPRVRGVPALIAALVIALYLGGTITALYGWIRAEANARLDDARDEIAARRSRLSNELATTLDARIGPWRTQVDHRVRLGAIVLGFLAIGVLAAGLIGLTAGSDLTVDHTATCDCTVTTTP